MAAAYAALVSLSHILNQILHPPPTHRFRIPTEQIQSLLEQVSSFVDFLENYSKSEEFTEDLEKRIAGASHRAEDIIESYVVTQIQARYRVHPQRKSSAPFLQSIPIHEVLTENAIVEVINEFISIREDLGEIGSSKGMEDVKPEDFKEASSSRSLPGGKDFMIGFDEHLVQIKTALVTCESGLQIIPVVGMGGVGKTTLATNVYNDAYIVEYFDVRAWVSISREYMERDIIMALLQQIYSNIETNRLNADELGNVLHKQLFGRRYFIVLDDLWDSQAWERLKLFLPDNNNGSRILVTTRLLNLAVDFNSCEPYQIGLLNDDCSWALILEQVFGKEDCPNELQYIGKSIARKCGGLPLALVVIGGLLSKSDKTREFWKYVEENVTSAANEENDEQCMKILRLSYSQLQVYLQPCFLYLAVFPKNVEIRVSRLIKLWVAEGLIKPASGRTLEEVAEGYLNDLFDRNLIMVSKRGLTGKMKTCSIHDLVRDLITREVHKNKFLCIAMLDNFSPHMKSERCLSIHIGTAEDKTCEILRSATLNRSFLSYSKWKSRRCLARSLNLLRILDVVDFYSMEEILQLFNSRYITCGTPRKSQALSSLISLLWNLQTLVVAGSLSLPSEIWQMPQLRHLKMPGITLPDPQGESDSIIVLENLQTLSTVKDFIFREQVLKRIPNLKKLGIDYDTTKEIGFFCLSNLVSLDKLESLVLAFRGTWENMTFPKSLKKLSLSYCQIPWEDMHVVGSLLNLEALKLQSRAAKGQTWNLNAGEFCRLKFFLIEQCEMETWVADDDGCFPCLEHLHLVSMKMKEIPMKFAEIPTLQTIDLNYCSRSLFASAKKISKEREDFGYEEIQVRSFSHLRIDKQTLFEHARKNMYCSRCNALLLEDFLQIVMYGKSLQQDAAGGPYNVRATDSQIDGDLCMDNGCHDDIQDPSVHPWGGLTAARDGTLTLLDYYLYSKSLKGLQNVFDSARARERERELLYPDACGGGGRGWISQGITGYGRAHGTRETCALHTARLSVETLVDFWSALGEETRQSLLRMKEEDFIERLMYRFDSKRFCRDCRRNVIREFKELKELKRMRRETRCTSWFCVADTAFQYEVSRDTVQADWHQTFSDAFGTYHHFEWAIGTGEGKSDILEFENVGLSGRVQVNGLDLSGLNACYITLRAWKMDGRCNELCVKAHALRGQQCVHCRLVVGDGFVTITRGEGITRFFEHAEEAEEEEDDDSMDKDGNELDGECSRPQKHAKSPELAREFLLDAATVIFKEQVEKAFREGTARQNAHSIFVCLALKLLEERVHVACKEIITLEKQMKLLEEEEKEKREEEERKERRRTKEREKKLRRKERLREKENREKKGAESHLDPVVDDVSKDELTPPPIDEGVTIVSSRESFSERGEDNPSSPLSHDILDEQLLTGCIYSNMDNLSEDTLDGEFGNTRDWNPPFSYDHIKYSRRKLKFRSDRDLNSKLSDRRKDTASSENGVVTSKYESRYHADGFESTRNFHGFNKQLRTNAAKSNVRNGSKLSEKFQWSNSRICEKYGSHSCSCDQHHEYRSRPETHIVRAVKDPKYVNKSESPADISKPYYRSKRYTQAQCAREINGRPKGKIIAGNLLTTKKVWEPLDSQKKCVRSNSDSDVTLKSPPKVEAAESDQVLECCSSCSDEVIDNSVLTSHKNDDPTDLSMSRAKNCGDIDNGFNTKENPHHYSKEAVAEDGELCSAERSTLGTSGSSMSTSSNSDNCSSCLSEGDSNTYSNHQNLESTSTSDSEESSQNSEGRVTSHCLGNGITAPHSVVDDQYKLRGIDATSEEAGTKPSSFLKEAAPYFETGRENLTTSAQPQSVLPQMHNQSMNYPVFQAPTVGYYHQSPVSWPVGSTNGLMSYPHASHYLFANTFGYGLNGNARIMQYGALQHLPPSLHNHAHVPVFQPVSQVNGVKAKEPAKVAHLTALKEVRHSTQKAAATTNQHPAEVAAVLDAKQSEKPDKMVMGNDGFSLFHFGGPVALSTGFKADEVTLEEGIMGDTTSPNFDDGDLSSNTKDSIEEYNLFAANNGIQFSIF